MAPNATVIPRVKKQKPKWSMTVMMNARDLSRDDDFLSHLLVEHLGTEDVPLQVHKMDPSRRLPKHNPAEIMAILKKYIVRKGGASTAAQRVKRAVDALLELPAVKQYLHKRSPSQINAFATHASRYLELYLPNGSIEISHTSRYSHRTGKSELCILATTPLKVGQVITDLKGSLAHLTVEEDEELKRTDTRRRDGGIRRDFSVIHSNQKNRSHLFLGPARFVNHDCEHNVELFRDGRIITFRVIKPIMTGQEVTAHYGDGYFGKGNRHCLCQTCETHGRGGYAPAEEDETDQDVDDSSTDEETRDARIKAGLGLVAKGNPNERRTRRGVYAILAEEDTDDEDRAGIAEGSVNGQSAMEASLSAGNPGNASIHRRLSDASTLTSLSDSEIPSPLIQEPLISLNSPRASPFIQPSNAIDNRSSTATPKTSRQSSGDVQDTLLISAIREKENTILENHKHTVQKDSRRPGRPAKRSIVVTSISESRKSSKSGTPVATPAPNNTSKQHFSIPRCGTCSNEITRLPGQKAAKPPTRTCPRCRRHFVIYGSPWPNRTMNLEPLSSSSDEDDEDDKHNLLDSSGKRRKIDLLAGAGRLVSNGQKLLEIAGKSPIVGEKRNWDSMNYVPEKEKIIRRLCSVPSLPFAKPIPALYARPSPVFFAKSSWTSAQFIDRGRDDDGTNSCASATKSMQREGTNSLPGLRLTRQTSSTRGMSLTPTSVLGQKRKRDSLPNSTKPKQKIGRTFYMKEGAKKMPKGWVLVTESSEETGDDEAGEEGEDDEGADDGKELAKENSLLGQANIPNSLEADKPTPTPTPNSHVTPAAQNGLKGPITNTTSTTNASASPKRRRARDSLTDLASGGGDPILDDTPSKNSSPRTRSRMKPATSVSTEDPTGSTGSRSALQDEVDSPPGMTNSGSTSECSVDTLPNDSNIDNGDVTLVVESNVISKDNSADSDTPIDVKSIQETIEETEVAQSALKISNLIHGTAFSFGHPDARTSWKPRYRYDESLGWVSEPVPST
ncbi:hypothetical protein Clacol_000792 [Clathrus columnatus]|uniref:SET domain-containing protein n=1 Tax=Clathrus columnatus TaxID=1419009 RepID=A0AAV4ZX73_9AGAM|nr:hypothetical protein Clacol_000792 [Clathrus columnatus]